MKHTLPTTLTLVMLFFTTQLLGIWLLTQNTALETQDGKIILKHADTAIGPRPETQGASSFLYLASAILIGTLLLLILIRYHQVQLWKIWYGLACFLTLSIALGVLLPTPWTFVLALTLTILKFYRPNPYIHNLTEMFIYAGIGVFLIPILTLYWSTLLLILISLYDMYAVWRSRHMIQMAQFQTQSNVFAGLTVPYKTATKVLPKPGRMSPPKLPRIEPKTAILGGGDLAFPLLYSGTVFENLLLTGQSLPAALTSTGIVVVGSSLALLLLFLLAKKDRFYPAMPFITLGCLVGYGVVLLL